jgi:hypothetical protein
LSDGVILGVDSAITIPSPTGVAKVYEKADKLFQLKDLPIGVATFGLGTLQNRSIGSFLREFEINDPNKVLSNYQSLASVVEEMRVFFSGIYMSTVAPALAKEIGSPFERIPPDKKPVLGFLVGGFSPKSFLSEVWSMLIPLHSQPNSAAANRKPGDFGTNWFAMYEPIQRYFKGVSESLLDEIVGFFTARSSPLSPQEQTQFASLLAKHEVQVPYWSMPIREGIEHVRFLVGMVVSHHRYAMGAPIVGGKVNIGLVTYKGEKFRILGENEIV